MMKKGAEQLSLFEGFGAAGEATPTGARVAAAPIEAATAMPVDEPSHETPARASATPDNSAAIVDAAGDDAVAVASTATTTARTEVLPADGVAFQAWSYSGYRLTPRERLRDALAKYEQRFGCAPPLVAVPLAEADDYTGLATPAMAVVPQPSVPRAALFLQLPAHDWEARRGAASDGEREGERGRQGRAARAGLGA